MNDTPDNGVWDFMSWWGWFEEIQRQRGIVASISYTL